MRQLHQEYPALAVRALCRWLSLSRGWYYASWARPVADGAAAAAERIALRDAIERIVLDFPGYGDRRVTHALRRAGWGPINHKRVLHVMREESLLCQLKRRFVVTTDAAHGYRTYPNLLKGATLDRLDQAWVADITYIRLPTAFAYLACMLDACSRRCIGWKLARQIDTHLTLAALEMAIERRAPQVGLIHHSDRGVQYASAAYVGRLEEIGARVSRSATGNPYDNAKAESFLADAQTRGGVSQGLPDVRRRPGQPRPVHRGCLHHQAAPLQPRLSAAGGVRSQPHPTNG
jgi:transposase InsO family protein